MVDARIDWIKTVLIPDLVISGKFCKSSNDDPAEQIIRDINISLVTAAESYMISMCFKVKVLLSNRYGEKIRHALVIKTTPDVDEATYDVVMFDVLFSNEETAYREIIPNFEKSDSYPRFYYSHRRHLDAVVALGDFTVDGWQMAKSLVNLSLDHILLAVEELGRFHGESYALKEQNRELFNELIGKFREARYIPNPPSHPLWDATLVTGPKRVTNAVRNSEYKDVIPESLLLDLERLFDYHKYGKNIVKPIEPMATICHGDFLRNNIAFKYSNTEKDKPIGAMMFDFQTLRYASPMIDFVTFIANSTGKDVRQPNFKLIFNTYHNKLIETYCRKTKISKDNIPDHFKYESFLKEYALYLPYGLSIASFFLFELHEPSNVTFSDMVKTDFNIEEHIQSAMTRGGDDVDREYAALVFDIYELNNQFNLEFLYLDAE